MMLCHRASNSLDLFDKCSNTAPVRPLNQAGRGLSQGSARMGSYNVHVDYRRLITTEPMQLPSFLGRQKADSISIT